MKQICLHGQSIKTRVEAATRTPSGGGTSSLHGQSIKTRVEAGSGSHISIPRTVYTDNPLKQGLKPCGDDGGLNFSLVYTDNPLKQGLKHLLARVRRPAEQSTRTIH